MLSVGLGSSGIHELIQKSIEDIRFEDYDFPSDVDNRGVKGIPNYYFRDDALSIWNAIEAYAKAVIEFFYQSDDDIKMDYELQDWIKEIYR